MNARTDSPKQDPDPAAAPLTAEEAAPETLPAAAPVTPIPSALAGVELAEASGPDRQQFVDWLRAVAPYIHTFRGKTFVIAFSGELVKAGVLNALVNDVALLHAMGMNVVLVFGSRPQVEEQLALRNVQSQYADGIRITDNAALECAKEAAG